MDKLLVSSVLLMIGLLVHGCEYPVVHDVVLNAAQADTELTIEVGECLRFHNGGEDWQTLQYAQKYNSLPFPTPVQHFSFNEANAGSACATYPSSDNGETYVPINTGVSRAASFQGGVGSVYLSDQSAIVSRGKDIPTGTDFGLVVLIKAPDSDDGETDDQVIVSQGFTDSTDNWRLVVHRRHSDEIEFRFFVDTNEVSGKYANVRTGVDTPIDDWFAAKHLIIVQCDSTGDCDMDTTTAGVRDRTLTYVKNQRNPISTNGGTFVIGNPYRHDNHYRGFKGYVEEVAVYHRTFTSEEINLMKTHFQANLPIFWTAHSEYREIEIPPSGTSDVLCFDKSQIVKFNEPKVDSRFGEALKRRDSGKDSSSRSDSSDSSRKTQQSNNNPSQSRSSSRSRTSASELVSKFTLKVKPAEQPQPEEGHHYDAMEIAPVSQPQSTQYPVAGVATTTADFEEQAKIDFGFSAKPSRKYTTILIAAAVTVTAIVVFAIVAFILSRKKESSEKTPLIY